MSRRLEHKIEKKLKDAGLLSTIYIIGHLNKIKITHVILFNPVNIM